MDLSFEALSTIIVSLGMSPVASGNTLRQLHKLLYELKLTVQNDTFIYDQILKG